MLTYYKCFIKFSENKNHIKKVLYPPNNVRPHNFRFINFKIFVSKIKRKSNVNSYVAFAFDLCYNFFEVNTMKENKNLEYKELVSNSFLKTVSAFANYGEGEIVFGIKDNGEIVGQQNPDKTCLDIENKINDSVKPKPDFSFNINRKTGVITLTVKEGVHKPYLYKGKAYKRNDTSTTEIDQIELKRLILMSENLYFEELPSPENDLKFNYLFNALKDKMNIQKPNMDTLKTLGLYDTKKQYNNAASLLADKNSFPGIDIIKFGTSINEILHRETIKNVSILEQLDRAENIFNSYYQIEEIFEMERKEKYLIPKEAFRETLANALIHRTWDTKVNIRIAMYSDKIEISSPGGLPIGLSEQEYLGGYVSNLRNPIIANVFFRLNIIEMFGTGIRRIKAAYKDKKHKAIFKVMENTIITILPSITAKENLSLDEKTIVDELSLGIHLASSELSQKTGFKKNKVIRLLNTLIDKNYISKEGLGKGTRYYSL